MTTDALAARRAKRAQSAAQPALAIETALTPKSIESIEALAAVMEVALEEGQAFNDSGVRAMISNLSDDLTLQLIALAHDRIETLSAPYRRGLDYLEFEIRNRLEKRRKDRGGPKDTSPIAMPHPLLEVTNSIEFEPYQIDVEALEEATRGLGDDDRKCLLIVQPEEHVPEKIIPAVRVPAHTIPRKVYPQNITTILAWIKRNAGSAHAKVIEAAITRPIKREVTKIVPKKAALPTRKPK